jgi:predicted nucleic acid-binding Zn ribbon protein
VSSALPPASREASASFCVLCGRPMGEDQEWCTECGAARTRIARAPDWRIPLAVIAVVVVLLVGLLVFAISELTHSAGNVTVVETTPARSSTGPATWPPGLDGWTVILAEEPSRASAERTASQLLGAHVQGVGVLDTAQHPEMKPPRTWEVFGGRYPSYRAAADAALGLAHHGHRTARPSLVQRPGQG